MKEITFIIPIHTYEEEYEQYILNALESIKRQKYRKGKSNVFLVIGSVCYDEIKEMIQKRIIDDSDFSCLLIELIKNEGDTSYQNQINLAVERVSTKYFSLLEFDDEISERYLKNMNDHINHTAPDILLPLIIETNKKNEGLNISNELLWSQQAIGDKGNLGVMNNEILLSNTNFNLSGATISKKSFLDVGGFKNNIKLTFMYEFLLRSVYNNLKVVGVPKVIYKHLIGRKNSAFNNAIDDMSINERRFWLETAKREYKFKNENREIKYEKKKE